MPAIDEWLNEIHTGDVLEILSTLPTDSIHMVMFSPPYWGMRDYNHEDQLGHEPTLEAYIDNLVTIGNELHRILRPDGSWWLNLGDGYATADDQLTTIDDTTDFRAKTKMLLPHRTAIALMENRWIARNDVVWAKTNPLPESVKDRLSTTFEFLFHFVHNEQYWYNLDPIREPYETDLEEEPPIGGIKHQDNQNRTYSGNTPDRTGNGKNPGDIFELPTDDYPDGHFAVYPEDLCVKPIKATCPPQTCAECRTPYGKTGEQDRDKATHWIQQCDCPSDDTLPGIVLDPMCGRGTTCKVAAELGREFIGVELNPEYAEIAREYVPDSRQRTFLEYV